LCAAGLLVGGVATAQGDRLPAEVAKIDTLTSRAAMQARVDSIVALGESAIPYLVPRLRSRRSVTEDAASAALRELCGPQHVPLLLDECLQARIAGVPTNAPSIIDYILRANPGIVRPPIGDGEVDPELSEIVELALAGEWEGVDLELSGDQPMLVVGAGLRTDKPMFSEGRAVEVVPLSWSDFLASIDDSMVLKGRDILRFSVRLVELGETASDCGTWLLEDQCAPTSLAFVSMFRFRFGGGYAPYGLADLWVKCGGRWRHASEYIYTAVTP